MKISSIIIAKNEEDNIGRCIESQKNVIDEVIVVVDSSSCDKTLEIVKSKNVKYFTSQWLGFSKTKEFAVSKATNDWILWIDADEALTPELGIEINTFKKDNPDYSAYSIPRRAYFLGKWIKHSGWYPGRVTRLFNKHNCKFSDSDVHEHLVINGKVGELKKDLDHYTDPNIHHYFDKFNSYTTLAAKDLAEKGKIASLTDILFRPAFFFVKMYILKLGFLDGLYGFILAVFSSCYVFTKYCKLWEFNIKNKDLK